MMPWRGTEGLMCYFFRGGFGRNCSNTCENPDKHERNLFVNWWIRFEVSSFEGDYLGCFYLLRYVSCHFLALSLEWLGKGTRWHMLCFFSGVWKEGAVLQFETGGFVKKSMLYFKVFLLFICSNSAENDKFGHYFWEGLKQKQQPLAFWWSIIKSNWLPWPLSDSFFQHFSNTGSIFKPGRSFVRWRGFFAYCMCCTRIKGSLRRCVLVKHPRLDHLAI